MKLLLFLCCAALATAVPAAETDLKIDRDVSYATPADPLQKLDIFAPPNAKNLPVIVWIHGGGWQTGDKARIQDKPWIFPEKGFVFVSINYRLFPAVPMGEIIRDCAKATGWVHQHIAEHGGDPERLLIMGHSAGAQLAAILCTDERYLQAEGVPFTALKGCVPVDGDTYDVPAIIITAQTRRKAHGQPEPKYGHPEKFGTPEQQHDYSAVYHVEKGKNIPPFLILHVADHPDTSAQAYRLFTVLKDAGFDPKIFGAKDTDHNKLNANLGVAHDPATKQLFEFLDAALKR